MFDIGGGELLMIVLFILIFFGPKKLPELAQSFGRGMREFKKAQREFSEHITTAFEDEQRRSTQMTTQSAPNTIARNGGRPAPVQPPDHEPANPDRPAPEPQPETPGPGTPDNPGAPDQDIPHPQISPTLVPKEDEDFPRVPPNA